MRGREGASGPAVAVGAPTGRSSRLGSLLVLAAILAVAVNLRASITGLGPLVPTIRADLGATNVALGLVGTIPVLAFGLVSPFAAALGRRVGVGRALAGSMVLLAGALALRSVGGFAWLLVGTMLMGVAIAVGNVLLPALVKGRFPHRVSQLTSAYTAAMVVGATAAAAVAVPVAEQASWQVSLGILAVPALLGAAVVVASLRLEGRLVAPRAAAVASGSSPVTGARGMLHHPLAWQVTVFMGLQSVLFYVPIAWLPDILVERGLTDAQAGGVVGAFNVAGLVGVVVIPLLHRARPDQRRSALAAGAFVTAGAALLLLPGVALALPAAVLMGVGSGGTISLVLSFFALRSTTPVAAGALSGMAQSVGYLFAASGPVVWGALRDATGAWTVPLVLLVAVAGATTVAGVAAGRDRVIG